LLLPIDFGDFSLIFNRLSLPEVIDKCYIGGNVILDLQLALASSKAWRAADERHHGRSCSVPRMHSDACSLQKPIWQICQQTCELNMNLSENLAGFNLGVIYPTREYWLLETSHSTFFKEKGLCFYIIIGS